MSGGAVHERFLREAVELAAENVRRGGRPFASVIAEGERLVASGANLVTATGDPTAHAEIVAIRSACARLGRPDLSDCALYTISEPCPMCMGVLLWANLGSVFFAVTKDVSAACGFTDFYPEFAKPFTERTLPLRHIEIAEARTVMEAGRLA